MRILALAIMMALAVPVPATAAPAPPVAADVCGYLGPLPPPSQDRTRLLVCYLNHAMDPAVHPPLPWPIAPDDPRLRARLLTFQRCAGIPADGIAGPQTWTALRRWANSGSHVC